MHLLATEPGTIDDGAAAVDLGQTPGDIILLASADTEIGLLAAAQARRRAYDPAAPSLRLAPVMRLGHNLSVDLYMELVGQARLVIARLLGGSAYWPYGVERLVKTCHEHGIPLALLPGEDKPDPELARLSSLPAEACRRLWRYLAEGGPGNAENFLCYAAWLLNERSERRPRNPPHPPIADATGPSLSPQAGRGACSGTVRTPSPRERGEGWGEGQLRWAEPAPLLRAGLYWPGQALPSLDEIAAEWRGDLGVVPVVFYRALMQSGNTAPVDALVQALAARRLRPLPVFVQSLKDAEAVALLADVFAAHAPDVILNATGFSLAASGGDDPPRADCAMPATASATSRRAAPN